MRQLLTDLRLSRFAAGKSRSFFTSSPLAPFEADSFQMAHATVTALLIAFATVTAVGLFMLLWRRVLLVRERNASRRTDRVSLPRGPGRCRTCHAAIIEEDSVFCPKCGNRLHTF